MSSPEALLDSLGNGLGPWSYALVGGLAFLETSAFVGLIAPGELAVVLGGVLAGRGQMQLPLLLAVVWAAAVAGDGCGFLLGRSLGRPFLTRHGARLGATPARLEQVERFFARHGAKAIVVGRFVGVVRAMGPFTAGASGMQTGRFLVADVVGAGLWAATFTGLGYLFAGSVGTLVDALHQVQLAGGIALVAAVVVVVVVHRRRVRA
jgi:membrane protein DedA with SNARE-associated domain